MRRIISIHAKMTTLPLLTQGKLNHKVSVEGRCANMHLWMHTCTYQEDPSGLVVFMRPCFSDCSRTVPMNIQWARREWLPKAQEKREQSENVPSNSHSHKHRHKCAHAHTHTIMGSHAALQQWEERATVTNSFGATKVAGNLSNGTIKLQLSFFSFFIADACISVASTHCNYPSHRRGISQVHWFIHTHCMCEILVLEKCLAL